MAGAVAAADGADDDIVARDGARDRGRVQDVARGHGDAGRRAELGRIADNRGDGVAALERFVENA